MVVILAVECYIDFIVEIPVVLFSNSMRIVDVLRQWDIMLM